MGARGAGATAADITNAAKNFSSVWRAGFAVWRAWLTVMLEGWLAVGTVRVGAGGRQPGIPHDPSPSQQQHFWWVLGSVTGCTCASAVLKTARRIQIKRFMGRPECRPWEPGRQI